MALVRRPSAAIERALFRCGPPTASSTRSVQSGAPKAAPARCTKPPSGRAPHPRWRQKPGCPSTIPTQMTCGGCLMAMPHQAALGVSTSASRQAAEACSGGWIDGSGGGRPAPAGGTDRPAAQWCSGGRPGAVRSQSAVPTAVVWVNGRSRPRRVMRWLRRSFSAASQHTPRRPTRGRRQLDPAWSFARPPTVMITVTRARISWSVLGRMTSLPASCWSLPRRRPTGPSPAGSPADPVADSPGTLRIGDLPTPFWPPTAAVRPC
jgi:hypothetical protein